MLSNSKKLEQLAQTLSSAEKEALSEIYKLRCLSAEQLYTFCFYEDYTNMNDFVNKSIIKLSNLDLIEVQASENIFVFFLTTSGVDMVRWLLSLPTNVLSENKSVIKRGYYRAAELKVAQRFIKHQLHLNQFLLNFKAKLNSDFEGMDYEYFDEKHSSLYSAIRPDGLLKFLGNHFFLEMDMGTERENQLIAKWKNYANFFSSSKYTEVNEKIIVLFICEGVKDVDQRREVVLKTAFQELGRFFGNRFEMYIGSTEEILTLMFESLVSQNNNSQHAQILLQEMHDVSIYQLNSVVSEQYIGNYGYYLRKISTSGELSCELLFDDWRLLQLSILTNIGFLNANDGILNRYFDTNIKYLILIESESKAYDLLRLANLPHNPRIVFTTISRIMDMDLPNAIFSVNPNGDLFHFGDTTLNKRVFEYKVIS